mmetsp:Transcript_20305/g.66045  ORF Transcript_20305/g.66045 Transcript_20305/m.66045 type:complete len:104 (-) Transcript_20305:112-423(-)
MSGDDFETFLLGVSAIILVGGVALSLGICLAEVVPLQGMKYQTRIVPKAELKELYNERERREQREAQLEAGRREAERARAEGQDRFDSITPASPAVRSGKTAW